jgi:hypothetical protein
MSVEALAVVLHHSRAKGTVKLVALGIANHDGDGGAWPSVATLARYANVHPRNVQKALVRLQQLGELHVEPQAGGLGNLADCDRPNLYHVTLRCPTWCDGTPQHRDQRKKAGPQLSSWHGPQAVDNGVAHTPPPGGIATPPGGGIATPPGGGIATPPGGGIATRTTPPNTPTEHRGAATVSTGDSPTAQLLARAASLPTCAECSQPADRCLRTPATVSGHTYVQPGAR